ncbi:putative 2-aminoethylphosphonate ABC transporter ATP-binding protein [Saezia sanguinis]|uniref:putative 2-aminoethylphosphonate ABC transporter ATP-binding protein n=1 Tax=Saezia sanguinis TaxID=1965230 RepID=UPI00302BDF1E
MNQPYLQLSGISKSYGNFAALRQVDLSIGQGELVCFLGPSGCGKTTLLRIIAGLEQQTSGSIHQCGQNISYAEPAKRDYGIVFQSYALFPNLTAAENVIYGLANHKHSRQHLQKCADQLLEQVGLKGSGNKFPSQMSGGQQQRVALARALATSPGLLLLDEPLSALDATVRQHLRKEICRLQRELNLTTIMVTHDQEEALSMADRIVVMNHGAIEQVGTPMEVYCNPVSPFVADFIGNANCLKAIAEGNGWFRCGDLRMRCSDEKGAGHFAAGQAVKLYLRPEDRIVGELLDDDSGKCRATVRRVEFLGDNCMAEVMVDRIPDQALQLQFTLNQMRDFNVREGSSLHFSMRPERMSIFPMN